MIDRDATCDVNISAYRTEHELSASASTSSLSASLTLARLTGQPKPQSRRMRLTMPLDVVIKLVCCFHVFSATVTGSNIVSSPQSVNISLNKVAVFNCTVIADSINWLINGSPFDNRSKYHKITVTLNEAKNLHKSTLTAIASPLNNKTNISCFVVTLTPFASSTSEPALLLIQGLLQSVNDLHSTAINSTTVLISWSPPFTLQGVPILGYNVTITNTISGENETMLVEDTTLLYSIDTNNNHTATVVPINEAGEGDPAFITIEIPIPSLMMFTPLQAVETSEIKRSLSTSTIQKTTSNTPTVYTAPVGNDTDEVPAAGYLSVIQLVSIITPVAAVLLLVTVVSVSALICCIRRDKKKKAATPATTAHVQDVITTDNNPVYMIMKEYKATIDLCDNTAYGVVS